MRRCWSRRHILLHQPHSIHPAPVFHIHIDSTCGGSSSLSQDTPISHTETEWSLEQRGMNTRREILRFNRYGNSARRTKLVPLVLNDPRGTRGCQPHPSTRPTTKIDVTGHNTSEGDDTSSGAIVHKVLDVTQNIAEVQYFSDEVLAQNTEEWLQLKSLNDEQEETVGRLDGATLKPVSSDENWALAVQREIYLSINADRDFMTEEDNAKARRLVKELLSNGFSTLEIAAKWEMRLNRWDFRIIFLMLRARNLYRIAFRLFEAAVIHYGGYTKHQRTLQQKTSALMLVDCMHRLNQAKTAFPGITISASSWSQRLNLVVENCVQFGLYKDLTDYDVKELFANATPNQLLLLYEDIKKYKIPFREEVLFRLMYYMAHHGHFTTAFEILHMLEGRLVKNKYGSKAKQRKFMTRELLYRLYLSGVPIHASELLEIILSTRSEIDPVLYNIFLFSAAKAGDVNTANALLRDMAPITGTAADLITFTSMFNMYKRLKDYDNMRNVHIEAMKRGLEPFKDRVFVNSFLHAQALQADGNYPYKRLYAEYRKFFKTAPLDALGLPQGHRPDQSIDSSDLLEPDRATLTIMLNSFFSEKERFLERKHLAWNIYQRLLQQALDVTPSGMYSNISEYPFCVLINTIGKTSQQLPLVLHIAEDMVRESALPEPTLVTWNFILRAFARHGDVASAEKIWSIIQNRLWKPDKYSYNAMMQVYVKAGIHEQAGQFYAKMRNSGWNDDWITERVLATTDQDAFFQGYRMEMTGNDALSTTTVKQQQDKDKVLGNDDTTFSSELSAW